VACLHHVHALTVRSNVMDGLDATWLSLTYTQQGQLPSNSSPACFLDFAAARGCSSPVYPGKALGHTLALAAGPSPEGSSCRCAVYAGRRGCRLSASAAVVQGRHLLNFLLPPGRWAVVPAMEHFGTGNDELWRLLLVEPCFNTAWLQQTVVAAEVGSNSRHCEQVG
jgi:hypothetical protein